MLFSNEVTYHRHASKFHIFFDTIVCHAGDIVKIYHNPERQFILHSDDEESDLIQILKNTKITGIPLELSECISFVVPENDESKVIT